MVLFLLICGQQWSWNLTIRYLDQLYLIKKVWHGMPVLLRAYSVLLIEMLSEIYSHTLPRNLWRIWLWIRVQSIICWSAEPREDTYGGWVSANGTTAIPDVKGSVAENNSIKNVRMRTEKSLVKKRYSPRQQQRNCWVIREWCQMYKSLVKIESRMKLLLLTLRI